MSGISRRALLRGSAAMTLATPVLALAAGGAEPVSAALPSAITALKPLTGDAQFITAAERAQRRSKFSNLLRERGVYAALIEPSATLDYFTGVRWGLSERLTAGLMTAEGGLVFITPAFEESRLREMVPADVEVMTWEEDEDPFVMLGDWIKRQTRQPVTLAVDETARYFIPYRLGQALPGSTLRSAADEVNACRLIKSPAELALMQMANDVTMHAYRAVYPLVERGMTGPEITALMLAAQRQLGGAAVDGGAQVDKGSALPHGSREPETVREGSVVLMDFSCTVGGYRSDISRTFVVGEPNDEQRRLWNLVRRGQQLAFDTAQPGTPAGEVDRKVRRMYESEGFGPGYQLPGLSHRLGHGIGLEVHEPINFVGNETMPLAAGMCFSNEPGIYVPGKYGVRLEDCIYITEDGPRWFSTPPDSLDAPIA
jgi:Xaa-Pro dipeptidase